MKTFNKVLTFLFLLFFININNFSESEKVKKSQKQSILSVFQKNKSLSIVGTVSIGEGSYIIYAKSKTNDLKKKNNQLQAEKTEIKTKLENKEKDYDLVNQLITEQGAGPAIANQDNALQMKIVTLIEKSQANNNPQSRELFLKEFLSNEFQDGPMQNNEEKLRKIIAQHNIVPEDADKLLQSFNKKEEKLKDILKKIASDHHISIQNIDNAEFADLCSAIDNEIITIKNSLGGNGNANVSTEQIDQLRNLIINDLRTCVPNVENEDLSTKSLSDLLNIVKNYRNKVKTNYNNLLNEKQTIENEKNNVENQTKNALKKIVDDNGISIQDIDNATVENLCSAIDNRIITIKNNLGSNGNANVPTEQIDQLRNFIINDLRTCVPNVENEDLSTKSLSDLLNIVKNYQNKVKTNYDNLLNEKQTIEIARNNLTNTVIPEIVTRAQEISEIYTGDKKINNIDVNTNNITTALSDLQSNIEYFFNDMKTFVEQFCGKNGYENMNKIKLGLEDIKKIDTVLKKVMPGINSMNEKVDILEEFSKYMSFQNLSEEKKRQLLAINEVNNSLKEMIDTNYNYIESKTIRNITEWIDEQSKKIINQDFQDGIKEYFSIKENKFLFGTMVFKQKKEDNKYYLEVSTLNKLSEDFIRIKTMLGEKPILLKPEEAIRFNNQNVKDLGLTKENLTNVIKSFVTCLDNVTRSILTNPK